MNLYINNNIIDTFLSLLKVKHTNKFTNQYFTEHPHKYSLFGLSKILSDYNIENVGIKINDKQQGIFEIETPFIAHVGNEFVIVNQVTEKNVQYLWNGNSIVLAHAEFHQMWTGIALIAESDENSIEPAYVEHRKQELFSFVQNTVLCVLVFFFIALTYYSKSLYQNLAVNIALLINLFGIYVSYLLVLKQINIHSKYADKICSLFEQGDCNNILESKASKFLGLIGWSEIGLGYFVANTFVILFFPLYIPYVALINICALPYTLWSIWYQKFRAKQWCPLCLIVQILLWALFATSLIGGFINIPDF